MKQFIRKFFAAAMLLSMTFAFSSCEGSLDDVFGKWDNPANVPPQVFEFKKVLDKGIPLVFNFELNGVSSSVTITNEGTKYNVTSTLSASNFDFQIKGDLGTLLISNGDEVEDYVGQIFFKISDGSYYIVNNIGANITFDGNVSVNGISGTVTNNCPDKAEIGIDDNGDKEPDRSIIIYYNKANSETWKDVAKRYRLCSILDGVLFASDSDGNPVPDIEDATNIVVELGNKDFVRYNLTSDSQVGIDEKIGDNSGVAFAGPYMASFYVAPTTAPLAIRD